MKQWTKDRMERLARDIRTRGWAVECVQPCDHPAYSYTIGLSLQGYPDLIVFGVPQEVAAYVFGLAIASMQTVPPAMVERQILHKEIIVETGVRMMLVRAPKEIARKYATAAEDASELADVETSYFQVVWGDTNGKLPWDAGFDEKFRDSQPLLRDQVLN